MTSIQERLQLKREPLDKWSVREQLCLASAVARSGDQNWVSVARALKPFGDPNRPPDWFSQKNCAAQYGALLGNVETPKRKKRQGGADAGMETPTETVLRRLFLERQAELKKLLAEEKAEYQKLHEDLLHLQSGKVTEEELDKWCKEIDEEERRKEQEALTHSQWLKEREQKKQEIERAWRPLKPTFVLPGQKRKSSDTLEGIESEGDDIQGQSPQITPPVPEISKPALSPLLTSLLKSPSQAQNVTASTSSILHTAITNQRVAANITNPTISSLLNSSTAVTVSPGLQQLVSSAIGQEPMIIPDHVQPITNDILDDPNLPNLKLDDLASSILVQDGPLPEIKKEEVDDIISEIIENAQDIVDDPEQHLQLDRNGDININIELEDLDEDDLAEVELESVEPKESPPEVPKTPEKPKENKVEKPPVPEVDPFEFQEDPVIFDTIKPSTPNKEKQYIPQYQQMQLHQSQQQIHQSQHIPQQMSSQQHYQHQPSQQQHHVQLQHHQLPRYSHHQEPKSVTQMASAVPVHHSPAKAVTQSVPPQREPEIVQPLQVFEQSKIEQPEEVEFQQDSQETATDETVTPEAKPMANEEIRFPQLEFSDKEQDVDEPSTKPIDSKEIDPTAPINNPKSTIPGSVEIVEVIMDDLECNKELDKRQIQDIVHSVKVEEPEVPEVKEDEHEERNVTEEELVEDHKDVEKIEEAQPVEDPEVKQDEVVVEEKTQDSSVIPDFNEELYDNISMEVKIDKTGKTKRDYSRTKKKEDKDLDMLLAIEKAHLDDTSDFNEESIDHIPEVSDKKHIKLKKLSENERSSSPWTEEEDISIAMSRRYSTPATPIDSVPNSPASSITFDDDRDYRNWKKSVMLVYNRLATNKYASLFLKPITEDQAPGYSSVIYRPMDLQTIKKNIESGVIRTTLEFKRDIMLMFTNAIMYNKTNDTVYNMAKQMQEESLNPIDILMQAQGQVSMPSRRETRMSESSSKRKRPAEDNSKNKRRKED